MDAHKNQLVNELKGLRQIQDRVRKNLHEENPDLLGTYVWSIFDLFFQNNFTNNIQTRIYQVELDSPR